MSCPKNCKNQPHDVNHLKDVNTKWLACRNIVATDFNVFQDATQLNAVRVQAQRFLHGFRQLGQMSKIDTTKAGKQLTLIQ